MDASRQKFRDLLRKAGCEVWLGEIFLYAEDPGSLEESKRFALERHISGCEHCRQELGRARTHLEEVRLKPVPEWVRRLAESAREPASALRHAVKGLRGAAGKAAENRSWISTIWVPHFAGLAVTAADIAEQSHAFRTTTGDVVITCNWQGPSGHKPAFLRVTWRAGIRFKGELVVRFTHAETAEVLADIPLGRDLEGAMTINSRRLGFDPSTTPWGMCLMLT
jgi:hypothetical protein